MRVNDVLRARGLGVGSKLSGDALPAHVRAGKTFMNADGEAVGTLPVRATGAQTVTPGTANITKTAGIYDGDIVIEGDADLITGNIKAGVTIFGVAGKTQVVDTTEAVAPAAAGNILAGKKAFVNGAAVTGTMTDRGAPTFSPGTTNQSIPAGYYSGGTVTGDADLIAANIKAGANIFGVAGATNVIDTTEAAGTAAAAGEILTGKNAFLNGAKIAGTMPNRGALSFTPGTTSQTIAAGYHNGSGTVAGDADLISANIKAGVNIFGVAGKTEVVDTTEVTAPASAAQIRSGQVAFVNGVKTTGTLAVQATGVQTVTPTTSNIVKAAGIYDGAITVAGDANLVTGNIRAGVSIFGVAGKTQVVDTTEATAAATAAQIRSGRVAFVNGSKITGTLAVQATGAQTVTPGTANVVKAAGIYDGAITIEGDADLTAGNLPKDVTIFGITGLLERMTAAQKTDLINLTNEAETNDSALKTQYINAVNNVDTYGGINLAANATWSDILANIPSINTGKKYASGSIANYTGGIITVTGLSFQPAIVYLWEPDVNPANNTVNFLAKHPTTGNYVDGYFGTAGSYNYMGSPPAQPVNGFAKQQNLLSGLVYWVAYE
jgi:hypothetical protein